MNRDITRISATGESQTKKVLLNKYEIMGEIGRGGTGRVYKAYDRHLQRMVAIKQIHRTDQGGVGSASLWNEAELLKQLEHPALPEIFDYFEENAHDCLVLEFIQGVTLEEYIDSTGPLQERQAVILIKELMEVFLYMHSFHPPVIYRDLKPANIMLSDNGQLKLIDFGTAFLSSCRQMGPGGLWSMKAGTPGFSAPEVLTADRNECGEYSDIYSIGSVFHYILTGAKPVVLSSVRRPVREYNPALSDGLEKVIRKCLQAQWERRYPNIRQLFQDMEHYKRLEKEKIRRTVMLRYFLLFMLSIGILLLLLEARKGIQLPFMLQGTGLVWDKQYLPSAGAVWGCALTGVGMCGRMISGIRYRPGRRQEKSIYLTEKRTVGLWGIIPTVCWILVAPYHRSATVNAEESFFYEAIEGEARQDGLLPVTLRDQDGYKLLIRKDSVYQPYRDMILELPLSGLPRGEKLSLQVVLNGDKQQYKSDPILIMIPVDR